MKVLLYLLFVYETSARCGYESCPQVDSGEADKEVLNVHLVPHSHDDVGWLKTVDQYYLGANREGWTGWEEVQKAGVQYTLDTVVDQLYYNPQRRFIQVETAFFWRWWIQQDQLTKDMVHQLVEEGQLEFVGGGWSMNDEGASHYAAIIDQMSIGLRILNQTFGECGRPRVAWQIDPFGHSKEQASMFANMGFDGLFFGRLDWRDKTRREESLEMEMIWRASEDLGSASDLFTGVLFNNYGPPPGFCWDLLCNDEPIMDNPDLEYNLDERIAAFAEYVLKQAEYYKSNNIILTMGMDFHYQAAHSWFMNLDLLIKYSDGLRIGGRRLHVFYSSPSCYLKSLGKAGLTWPPKSDDFFPYASDPHAYWSGYFTSRPTSKGMIREAEKKLKTFSQLSVLTNLSREKTEMLDLLRHTVGIVQHHDAVTGTEKQHVADDYHRRIHAALQHTHSAFSLTAEQQTCLLLNISQCPAAEQFTGELSVSLYSPLSRQRNFNLHLPVVDGEYRVEDESGAEVPSQLVPLPDHVINIPGRSSSATMDLVVALENLKPLNFENLRVIQKSRDRPSENRQRKRSGKVRLENSLHVLTYHQASNRFYLTNKITKEMTDFALDLMYYRGHRGNNSEFDYRASGAYIFRPDGDDPVSFGAPVSMEEHDGPVVSEVHLRFSEDWASLIIRVYNNEPYVEIDWTVGPIPVDDGVGKEVILRYSTSINNQGEFFTDSNGRQLMRRLRNYRPTFEINMTEPTAQNYYPVNSKLLIRDDKMEMCVLVDRSQGGGSIVDGSLELMLHRRLLDDDAFGVGEALNEVAYGTGLVVRGKHWLFLNGDADTAVEQHRLKAMEMFHTPEVIFNTPPVKFDVEFLSVLPRSVHLLSLEKFYDGDEDQYLLLRIEHVFQTGEHSLLSQPITIDIRDLFLGMYIERIGETGLGGNLWREEIHKIRFDAETNDIQENTGEWFTRQEDQQPNLDQIELRPMEIRTFVIKYSVI